MSDPTKAELALVLAKAKCFKVCDSVEPALADKAHEPHRAALEAAYAAFQGASTSNPASGTTQLDAHLTVESN